jgi:beta-lactamase superfamily II metal-dependent hydrolase
MFRIELLPAAHGDAIWIEYGDAKHPRRIVIDGGPAPTYEAALRHRLLQLPEGSRHIDLFVVTHIDCDHIDGAIILLREAKALRVTFGEIWFNAWDQLQTETAATFKPIQGEFLGALLATTSVNRKWNKRVGGRAIMVPESGPLPSWELEDGARLTLLSPGVKQIRRLRARWESAMREFSGDSAEALRRLEARREYRPPVSPPVFGIRTPGDDRSVANASSIAFALEFGERTALLAADAQPRILIDSLRRLALQRSPLRGEVIHFDAVKLPHHGSMGNVSDELLDVMESPLWLVSTNGAIFDHPDRETAELITRRSPGPPTFVCNYRSASTVRLADTSSRSRWRTLYPGDGVESGPSGGAQIDLLPLRPTASRAKKRPGKGRKA